MLYATAHGTGLRQGELLALRWQDIDLEAGTLTVRTLAMQDRLAQRMEAVLGA